MDVDREAAAVRELLERAEGLELDAEAVRWEVAERAFNATNGTGTSLRDFAAMIGRHHSFVGRFVKAWATFGVEDPRHRPRFADAYELASMQPDRQAQVQALAEATGKTIASAARDLRQTSATKVELARELLSDPVILARVLDDEEVLPDLVQAVRSKVADNAQERTNARDHERVSGSERAHAVVSDVLTISVELNKARTAVELAAAASRRAGLNDEERAVTLEEVRLVSGAAQAFELWLRSDEGTMDEELKKLLAAG